MARRRKDAPGPNVGPDNPIDRITAGMSLGTKAPNPIDALADPTDHGDTDDDGRVSRNEYNDDGTRRRIGIDHDPALRRKIKLRTHRRLIREDAAIEQIGSLPPAGSEVILILSGKWHGFDLIGAVLKLAAPEEAEEDCTAALALEAGHVKALLRRAQARQQLGSYDDALEDLERALAVAPKNSVARRQLAECRQLRARAAPKRAPPTRKLEVVQVEHDADNDADPFVQAVGAEPPPEQTGSEPPAADAAPSAAASAWAGSLAGTGAGAARPRTKRCSQPGAALTSSVCSWVSPSSWNAMASFRPESIGGMDSSGFPSRVSANSMAS